MSFPWGFLKGSVVVRGVGGYIKMRSTSPGGRNRTRRRGGVLAVLATVALVLGPLALTSPASADTGDVGTQGLSHSGTGTPTGTKRAESVLWYNAGSWWGNLWDTASSDFHIFQFKSGTWVDT